MLFHEFLLHVYHLLKLVICYMISRYLCKAIYHAVGSSGLLGGATRFALWLKTACSFKEVALSLE